MPVAPNTQFEHYEILAPLGAGGMGEVYKAHDTHLNREVAIKVLPGEVAHDAERLRRFEQEARAVGALNHPNILTVYDFGSHEGNPFIVMELLEGEELRAALDNGALPARKATDYAQQIANGLSAAHAKNIVHRDLKPANLFVTSDGRVKILDFGLAKLMKLRNAEFGMRNEEADTLIQGEANIPQSPIRNPHSTDPGVVMGTVGYMSPEQVNGQVADHRSDIFSFGVILYEMLSGQRAFTRSSMVETMHAILKDEPPELSESNAKISPALDKIVRRCLEKKPERRFQTASDLGFALEALATPNSSGTNRTEAVAALTTSSSKPGSGWRERIWMIAAGVFALLALALGVAYVRRPAMQTPATTMRLSVNPPEGAAVFERPVISPDGQMLAFVARTTGTPQIWVRRMDSPTARPLDGTGNATPMFWSPDSQWLAFTAGGKLRKIALAGGAPVVLYDQSVHSGDWNQDGVILFTARAGLKRMDANGGNVADATTIDAAQGESAHVSPVFLPDGRHFLFYVLHNEPSKRGIYARALEGGQAKLVLNTEVYTFWAGVNPAAPGEGWLMFMQQGTLLAQSFDFTHHQVSGTPFRIADQVRTTIIGTLDGQFSLSNNGVLVFSEGRENQRLVLTDRQGQKLQPLGSLGLYGFPRFSPDGQRVAIGRFDPQNQSQDIHLLDLAGGRDIRFTVDPGEDGYPLWSPDGNRIVWAARRGGVRDLFGKATNGAGEEELLWKSPNAKFPMDWSKDGRFIAYTESAPGTNLDIWILSLTGERKAWPWLKTRFSESTARFSPDGKWIAYQSNAPGRNEVFVRAFNPDAPDTGGQWQISTNGGERPAWRNDGRELYYLAPDEKLMAVEVTLGAEVKAGTPRALFDLRALRAVTANVSYAATGDGQRFLFVTSAEDATLTPFTVVTNWMAEVKK